MNKGTIRYDTLNLMQGIETKVSLRDWKELFILVGLLLMNPIRSGFHVIRYLLSVCVRVSLNKDP